MHRRSERHDFASDNTAGICPEAWSALDTANCESASSYGEDKWSLALSQRVRELFETDCAVYPVFNGTAANALALAQLCRSFEAIVCHERSHLHTDECGAPEFFTGGSKLLLIGGANGKIDLAEASATVARHRDLHAHKPRAISVTQATELGTVYSIDEIARVSEFARQRQMLLHMDGARFANAVAYLNCQPKEITWQLGVDVLCFGGTKNGLAAGELVIFFKSEPARDFEYRVKQSGQLASKMRFLSAPWNAILHDDIWLKNARHANAAAQKLSQRLRSKAKLNPIFPVEANAIFLRLNADQVAALHARGWRFYKHIEPDVYRLMCSWSVTESDLEEFAADVEAILPSP